MVFFEKKVLEYIEKHQLITQHDRLLIACSGGIDSMGLLQFFLKVKEQMNVEVFVAHVDHMLRGKISFLDRQFVEAFCEEKGIPIYSTSINIPKILQEEGGNSQAICRRERYQFFAQVLKEHSITKLVTAHHADDQLESLLMAITKAGNINALKGMRPIRKFQSGFLIRPFLCVKKSEIYEFLVQNNLSYREDASNEKDDYMRNRFRHHIVPMLKNENPNVVMNAVQITENLQQDDEFLTQLAIERFSHIVKKNQQNFYVLDINRFDEEPVALQRRIILILLNYLNGHNTIENSALIASIQKLCQSKEGNAQVYLPNGFVANRQYSQIVFVDKKTQKEIVEQVQLKFNEWTDLNLGIRIYIGDTFHEKNTISSEKYYLSSHDFPLPYTIRQRATGDRILLKGMEKPKRLSRLFIDEKIPLQLRNEWPILTDDSGEIISVLGIKVHRNLSTEKNEHTDLVLIVERS